MGRTVKASVNTPASEKGAGKNQYAASMGWDGPGPLHQHHHMPLSSRRIVFCGRLKINHITSNENFPLAWYCCEHIPFTAYALLILKCIIFRHFLMILWHIFEYPPKHNYSVFFKYMFMCNQRLVLMCFFYAFHQKNWKIFFKERVLSWELGGRGKNWCLSKGFILSNWGTIKNF